MLLASLPVVLVVVALVYQMGMTYLEGEPREFGESLEWASETLTTTGYGADARWKHPFMVGFVVVMQFFGLFLVFLAFPIYVLPFFEERFEARLPRNLAGHHDFVLVYKYGPSVSSVIEELQRAKKAVVVLEDDEHVARRTLERGIPVVYGNLEEDDEVLKGVARADAIIANGEDHDNAALILVARQSEFRGKVYAFAEEPLHRQPLMLAGADNVFTPRHVLAAALAAKASLRISPRVAGWRQLGDHVGLEELRIHRKSPLAGLTLAEADLTARAGVTIIGKWVGGEFHAKLTPQTRLEVGSIIVAIGPHDNLERLEELATPLPGSGPFVVAGFGAVGKKVVELLHDAGEETRVIDVRDQEGVDVVGNAFERHVLEEAQVLGARGVILTLGSDSATLFAATVVRDFAPEVPLIARVDRVQNVTRMHRAGTDLALSIGNVAGQILAHQLLGESYVSLEEHVRVVRVAATGLRDRHPHRAQVRERTGCSVVAAARGDDVWVDFPPEFRVRDTDVLYICGSSDALDRYFKTYPGARGEG